MRVFGAAPSNKERRPLAGWGAGSLPAVTSQHAGQRPAPQPPSRRRSEFLLALLFLLACRPHGRVIDAGSGEPVVLIHGLGSSADINWRRPGTVDLLSKHFRVIAPNLGTSSRGLEMVDDVTHLLDRLGIRSAHIVGYSLITVPVEVIIGDRDSARARSLVVRGQRSARRRSVADLNVTCVVRPPLRRIVIVVER